MRSDIEPWHGGHLTPKELLQNLMVLPFPETAWQDLAMQSLHTSLTAVPSSDSMTEFGSATIV